jgi:hypothetical protein
MSSVAILPDIMPIFGDRVSYVRDLPFRLYRWIREYSLPIPLAERLIEPGVAK